MNQIHTAAVIPAYNEQRGIGAVVEAARAATLVDLVVVVDDGSQDATYDNALEASLLDIDTPVELVRNERNTGKVAAAISGVARAREVGGLTLSTIAFFDADSLPIWSRDTQMNMKLWQKGVHQALGISRIVLQQEIIDGRNQNFINLLARYMDEIVEPVATGVNIMKTGMYQRNTFTDTFLPHISQKGGHAGNRAISSELWDKFILAYDEAKTTSTWGLEAGLNALVDDEESFSTFIMYGIVNVGSRMKAGSSLKGLKRMWKIHAQTPRTRADFRR